MIGDNSGSDVIGTIRILDQRQFVENTVTLNGSDPRWLMPSLHRDTSDCYSRLIVRGGLQTGATTLAVKQWPGSSFTSTWAPSGSGAIPNGGILPDFIWGSFTTNAAAEAAWSPNAYSQLSLQSGQDQGSCTCPSTTTVVITSQNTSLTLAADQLDQTDTGQHAVLTVVSDVITGVQQLFSARVVANTAMTAGGTSTLTLDQPLPDTTYNSYRLYALSFAGNVVWRRYKVMNAAVAAAMQQSFPYPFAFRNSNGTAAALTMAPMANVLWSASGSPPYNQSTIGCVVDPVAGTITTVSPTSLVYGGGVVTPPSDVQVFVPIATDVLETMFPTSGYGGTLYSVEGIERTKVITVRDWTDYGQSANMAVYAAEAFGSLCDVVIEGEVRYLGLATSYISPGQAISITGNGYTTGYEAITNYGGNNGIAVASLEIQFNPGPGGTSYVSTLNLSNRKQKYTAEIFIRPAVRGQPFGGKSMDSYVGAMSKATSGMWNAGATMASGMMPSDQSGGAMNASVDPNTYHRKPPAEKRADWTTGARDEELFGTAEASRRERAASHGSLRESRGIPESTDDPVIPQTLGQAADAMIPAVDPSTVTGPDAARERRRQRARDDGQYGDQGGGP